MEQALAAQVIRTLEEDDDIYDAEADDEIDEQAYDGFADP